MAHAYPLTAPAAFRRGAVRTVMALALTAAAAATPVASLAPAAADALRAQAGVVDPGLHGTGRVEVVVTGAPGASALVAAAVRATGGLVTSELPIVDGVAATVPAAALAELGTAPGVRAVSANRDVHFSELNYTDDTTASYFARTSGATAAWAAGRTGTGVGVAVIDTGISSMNDFSGRLVHGPDLSGEGSTVDSYGHGTVMAGIIGGSGRDSATQNSGAYTGVAPGATLVAVKTAGRNGAADVTTMLQAMHWVSAYKDQFNIRVLNISWGYASTQAPDVDPLNYAVERLWKQGIVVVVAAGNSGPSAGTVTKPADDPLVLTVGAYNDKGDLGLTNDAMVDWSSRGPTAQGLAKPDVVAPGRTLVSPRSYGSAVERENPKALISPSYIKGSGTSQAAAVVSGLAALLLQHRPDLTPDQVKSLLRRTASPLPNTSVNEQGAGRVQLGAALSADPGAAVQSFTSSGLGSIEASRAGRNVVSDCGNDGTMDVIRGEIDTRCQAWDGNAWTGNAWTGNTWTGNTWTGNTWTGNTWTGNAWTNATWTGNAWTGGTWSGNAWTGNAWTGNTWTGNTWTGNAWTGSTWTGNAWTGNTWTGNAWTTGEYDIYDPIFATAFFGSRPKYGKHVAGEQSDGPPAVCKAAANLGLRIIRSCDI